MKKILITFISIISIISILSFSCFATDTTIEPEITITPLVDNSIISITYNFYNLNINTDDYVNLVKGLYYLGATNYNGLGSCYGRDANNGIFHNYKLYTATQPPFTSAACRLYLNGVVVNSIYTYELVVENSADNQTAISFLNSISNKKANYTYSNVVSSGFNNSIKILGYSLKTFLQNQYIKLAIGLACGTFFVSFAIFKTKSLIKGY